MIKFTKYIWLYICISSLVILPGIYSLFRYGLRLSVDFTGGTLMEVRMQRQITLEDVKTVAEKYQIPAFSVQKTNEGTYLMRMGQQSETIVTDFIKALEIKNNQPVEIQRDETVGPVLGKELLVKSCYAAAFAMVAILLYVAYAFKNFKNGMAAVIALIHDVVVVFGCFSLFGHFAHVEVDTLFVTAFLTTMSFSVHDTIVIFDRIREYSRKEQRGLSEDIVNVALTETMGRSLVNSFTIIFMLLALVLMGGETIKWFAVALLIGTITGTYSSPFVATPIVLLMNSLEKRKK